MRGAIYFIACSETFRVKIGFTAGDPHKRLRALQTGSPTELVLIETYPGTQQDERDLHMKFAACRLHGEWFEPTQELFRHLCCVSFVNGKHAAHSGEVLTDLTRRGLELIHTEVRPLPSDLAALIGAAA